MPSEFPFAQPLIFEPIFKERVWGGRQLESLFGKKLPPGKLIGESWEIVDRPEAQSVVRQGPLRGRTLHELWLHHRPEIFGETVADTPRFPLLAKLLDAREKLSLQVHPPAAIAEKLGGEAKSELWYCAATEPDAELFAGLRRGVQRSQFEEALERDATAELVHRLHVQPGDAFFVPSGRLHAIGAGNLMVEISQNSDTTYRLFDWNRAAREGAAREMHLEQALASIDFTDFEPDLLRADGEQLVRCPHFAVAKWQLDRPRAIMNDRGCVIVVCLSGAIEIGGTLFNPGDFFLIPTCPEGTALTPAGEETSLLITTLPIR